MTRPTLLLQLLVMIGCVIPINALAADGEKFAWEEIATAPTGDIYSLDRKSIEPSRYLERQVLKVTIKVEKFTGHPAIDNLFGIFYFDCQEHAWRTILAGGKKPDGKLVTMPDMAAGLFNKAPEGAPMRAVIDRACSQR